MSGAVSNWIAPAPAPAPAPALAPNGTDTAGCAPTPILTDRILYVDFVAFGINIRLSNPKLLGQNFKFMNKKNNT